MHLVQERTPELKKGRASPLTPLQIPGEENAMTDIHHARLAVIFLGFVKNDSDLLNLFNINPPLPNQSSCTVFIPSNTVIMKVILVLRM